LNDLIGIIYLPLHVLCIASTHHCHDRLAILPLQRMPKSNVTVSKAGNFQHPLVGPGITNTYAHVKDSACAWRDSDSHGSASEDHGHIPRLSRCWALSVDLTSLLADLLSTIRDFTSHHTLRQHI